MTHAIKTILLVDDETRLLNSMAQRLSLLGLEPLKAVSGAQALEQARINQIDLAIVDYKLPDMDGLTTITRLKEIDPDLKTVLLTGYGSGKTRRASRELDTEYFEKDAMGGLWDLIKHLDSQGSLVMSNSPKKIQDSRHPAERTDTGPALADNSASALVSQVDTLPRFIGETVDMQRLRKDIKRLADLDCTISIRGEAGTGKELAARSIHRLSRRRHQRFLAFNCGCFSDGFQFRELLGAIDPSAPFSGTILLDHVEAMPAATQKELITLLADKPGGNAEDIRFIVASHQDLKSRVTQGRFSSKLFNHLSAIGLSIPSLRERREDISPLSAYFLKTLNAEFNKDIQSISEQVLALFMAYPFPGNVRELKYIIERAVILADGPEITPAHLPERFVLPSSGNKRLVHASDKQLPTLDELEKGHILKALELTGGNKSKASEILGISRAALWRKLKLMDKKEA